MRDIKALEGMARIIRMDIIRMIANAQSGHPGGSLGAAEILTSLYFSEMRHRPENPAWDQRDRFYLSNAHVCPVLYATLAHAGYFPREELMSFRKIGSRLQGHVHRASTPGVENTGGPLGQGLSQAIGCAHGLQMQGSDAHVYVMVGDGELEEGMCWEALLFVGNAHADNVTIIVDRNHIQIDGTSERVMDIEPLADKIRSFGITTLLAEGNDFPSLIGTLRAARDIHGPACIIAETTPGKGVSFMEGKPEWHGRAPDAREAKQALEELSR